MKDAPEKEIFFSRLSSTHQSLPLAFLKFKVVRVLANALEVGSVAIDVLPTVLNMAEKYYDETEYTSIIMALLVDFLSITHPSFSSDSSLQPTDRSA